MTPQPDPRPADPGAHPAARTGAHDGAARPVVDAAAELELARTQPIDISTLLAG